VYILTDHIFFESKFQSEFTSSENDLPMIVSSDLAYPTNAMSALSFNGSVINLFFLR